MDAPNLHGRAFKRVLRSPLVSIPGVVGAGLFLLAVIGGAPVGTLGLVGLAGMGAAAVVAAFRWWTARDKYLEKARHDLLRDQQRTEMARLNHLRRQVRADADVRTNRAIGKLRDLYRRLVQVRAEGRPSDAPTVAELQQSAERLYRSCLAALERSLAQWDAAQQMTTEESRGQMLASREALLAELDESIGHLGRTLDHLQAMPLKHDPRGEDLARVREELDMGLAVARRVEQRMDELDRDLGPRRAELPG
jgi:hypothetical protein